MIKLINVTRNALLEFLKNLFQDAFKVLTLMEESVKGYIENSAKSKVFYFEACPVNNTYSFYES